MRLYRYRDVNLKWPGVTGQIAPAILRNGGTHDVTGAPGGIKQDCSPFGVGVGVEQVDTLETDGRTMTATQRTLELLSGNLQEVFGEGDATRRRAAIEDFYTDDCVVYSPDGTYVGHDAVDKFAGDLRATHPHFVYTHSGEPQVLQNAGIVAWGSGPRGEEPEYTGLDVLLVRDGKIVALYVFLNPKLS